MIPAAFLMMLACADPPAPPPPANLAGVRRIYVDSLNGGTSAAQIRDLIIAALERGGRITVTENRATADAELRGSAEEQAYTDKFSSSDGAATRSNSGDRNSTVKGVTKAGRYSGLSVSDHDSVHIEERRHEALATVRLVNKDGDVIWSATVESRGAKLLGAGADVAAQVARRLGDELDQARKAGSPRNANALER